MFFNLITLLSIRELLIKKCGIKLFGNFFSIHINLS